MAFSLGSENLVRTLVGHFSDGERVPNLDEVTETAKKLADVFEFVGDVSDIVDEALQSINIRMGVGNSLVDHEAKHDPDWVRNREINWTYWNNYSEYLREEGWNSSVVSSLGVVTESIGGLLQDPDAEGEWDRRGLVIGHVQSGKTANYLGLVARAADAGYKFIVIVAGIHNNLRKQTQERVDEGFVGKSSDPDDAKKLIGVGLYPDHPIPVALTTVLEDFKKNDARKVRSSLKDWSKPVVVVIKKNVSTLNQIHSWLKDFNLDVGQDQIADVPMLFLDDEADNASVNTSKPDLDPTKTNKLIREILALFKKSCYVGYTATPFANIFINPDAYDDETREDLFPKDFIYCLDAPNNYFGADKIFLNEEGSEKHLRAISDAEDILPLKHKKDIEIYDLPQSLKDAVQTFVLIRAIRNVRGQEHKHCSMLVNVSRFVDTQKTVRVLLNDYLQGLTDAIRANYALPDSTALQNKYISSLKYIFEDEFSTSGHDWPSIKSALFEAVQAVRLFVVNSKSDEPLDYSKYEKGLTAIAVGGLSLSRGLTIEGLAVSYMYRNTKMYDTLMQMGRWFGYRPGYEDLCRVYLSEESAGWYSHIAEATEELRDRIKEMRRYGKTPKDFGLLVRSHPDALLVTALNKMQNAEKQIVEVSYDGMLRETFVLPENETINAQNRDIFKKFYTKLENDFSDKLSKGAKPECKFWSGINAETVDWFLSRFHFSSHHEITQTTIRSYLDRIRSEFPVWDVAFISLKGERGSPVSFGNFTMIAQERAAGKEQDGHLKKSAEGEGYWISNKQRVAGTGDEIVGLTEPSISKAKLLADEHGRKGPTDRDFRHIDVRGRPLLMLHLIDLVHKKNKTEKPIQLLENAPAIGASFPATGQFKKVEYVLSKVMLQQLEREKSETPDADEDYDE